LKTIHGVHEIDFSIIFQAIQRSRSLQSFDYHDRQSNFVEIWKVRLGELILNSTSLVELNLNVVDLNTSETIHILETMAKNHFLVKIGFKSILSITNRNAVSANAAEVAQCRTAILSILSSRNTREFRFWHWDETFNEFDQTELITAFCHNPHILHFQFLNFFETGISKRDKFGDLMKEVSAFIFKIGRVLSAFRSNALRLPYEIIEAIALSLLPDGLWDQFRWLMIFKCAVDRTTVGRLDFNGREFNAQSLFTLCSVYHKCIS
jgi:hypothetical protein